MSEPWALGWETIAALRAASATQLDGNELPTMALGRDPDAVSEMVPAVLGAKRSHIATHDARQCTALAALACVDMLGPRVPSRDRFFGGDHAP
jgi:hypothetical protein